MLAPAAQHHGLQHEVLSPGQVAARFPAYQLPAGFQTMYEPEGGVLVPEKCTEAHLRLAQQKHNAQLLCGTKVLSWQVGSAAAPSSEQPGGVPATAGNHMEGEGEEVVQVHTSSGETFHTRRLVLAGGGWMPHLVPELKVRCAGHSSGMGLS